MPEIARDGKRESFLGFAATSGIQATENAEIAEERSTAENPATPA